MGQPRPRTEETLPALPLGCALSCLPWLSVLLAEVCPSRELSASSHLLLLHHSNHCGGEGWPLTPRTSAPGMQLRLGPRCPTLLRPGLSSPQIPKLVKKPKSLVEQILLFPRTALIIFRWVNACPECCVAAIQCWAGRSHRLFVWFPLETLWVGRAPSGLVPSVCLSLVS